MNFLPTALFLLGVTSQATNLVAAERPDKQLSTIFEQRASATLDSVYSLYSIPGSPLLRENYPHDNEYKATYLASEDKNTSTQERCSYLWPFSGTLSATVALYEASENKDIIAQVDNRVLPGLRQYLDTKRNPKAYASYINSAPQSDRFYDDNIWLGIDFSDLYLVSHQKQYLSQTRMIWQFVESGTDEKLGGGIYWCEQKKHSKNTCSNAPGTVYALKLYQATADKSYLTKGKKLYEWTKAHLQDPKDGLYYDNIALNGRIGKTKYAYNSGQMLQAATLLYKITKKKAYLKEAQRIAQACYDYFFDGTASDDQGSFKLLSKGNIWFTAVMMRGFCELYEADGNPKYMDAFVRNLNYAWSHSRDGKTGLFNSDWSGKSRDEKKWLLTQAAMSEMFAKAAIYLKSRNQ